MDAPQFATTEQARKPIDQAREIFESDRCPCCGNFKRIREDMLCKTCFWKLSKEFKNAIKYKPKGWVEKFFIALAMLKKDREKSS
jgi:hypothetical protein